MPHKALLTLLLSLIPALAPTLGCAQADRTIRVATYNIEDVRSPDLDDPDHPRLSRVASVISELNPDIILINELAADQTAPGQTGNLQNGQRFSDTFLAGKYTAITLGSNTGVPSRHDLNNDGRIVTKHPATEAATPDASPPRQTAEQRAFGNDAYGFGTFPGQYSMALLTKPGYTVLHDQIRTYRLFKWSDLPGATTPTNLDAMPWYTTHEWADLRLPSKTLAIVPVRTPTGVVIHCVISHPTPPAFDGPERRNKIRNRDEIRLLRAVLDNEPWLTDDQGKPGGLSPDAHAVVLGDLNADPIDGSSVDNPIAHLLASPRLATDPKPTSDIPIDRLDPWDTSMFRLRVDYVLPTKGLHVQQTSIWRPAPDALNQNPSDHFPVWADILLPDAPTR